MHSYVTPGDENCGDVDFRLVVGFGAAILERFLNTLEARVEHG